MAEAAAAAAPSASVVSTTERACPEVPSPARVPISSAQLWLPSGLPNHEALRLHLLAEGRLSQADALKLIGMAKEAYRAQPNLLELDAPLTGVFSIVVFVGC
jgi:serine/threonine-protein phosphatase 2B catalytic subunit